MKTTTAALRQQVGGDAPPTAHSPEAVEQQTTGSAKSVSPPGWRQFDRVQTIMEDDPAARRWLGDKTHECQKRNGEIVKHSNEAVMLAQAFFHENLDAAKATRQAILSRAVKVLRPLKNGTPYDEAGATAATGAAKGSNEANRKNEAKEGQEATTTDSATIQSGGPGAKDAGSEEIEIIYGAAKGHYVVHPVARMFPMIQGQGYDDLVQSLDKDGQQEDCVVAGDMILDGRNRVNGLNQLGREVRVVQFAELKTGLSPAAWIMTKNLQRRHLTDDQYLAITANYLAWCKDEAERQRAESDSKQSAQGETNAESQTQDAAGASDTEFPQKAAENTSKRKRGRPRGNRSEAETLAKQARQSEHRARQIVKLRAESPELATAVEEGRMSLKDAIKQLKAKASAKQTRSHPKDDVDQPAKAVAKANQMLSKLASTLDLAERVSFWHQVVEFAKSQAGEGEAAK